MGLRESSRALWPARTVTTCGALMGALLLCAPASGQPANDECVNATMVPSIPFTDSVDTTTATSNPADPSLGCNGNGAQTDGNTVWYVWTPDEDITVNISTAGSTQADGGPLDTAHGVFTGTCGDLTQVACVDVGANDDLLFEATAGETYYIKFGEFLDGVGGGDLVVTIEPATATGAAGPGVGARRSLAAELHLRAADQRPAAALSDACGPPADIRVEEVPMFTRGAGQGAGRLVPAGAPRLQAEPSGALSTESTAASGGDPRRTPERLKATILQVIDGADNDDNAFQAGVLLAPPTPTATWAPTTTCR